MKNHSRSGMKRGKLGYRTASSFRFTSHDRARAAKSSAPKWSGKIGNKD